MRRFLAAVLSSSLPLLVAVPVSADAGRTLEYTVVATSGGVARQASVTVDFIGGSANRVMNVNVGERNDGDGNRQAAYVGIEPSGALQAASPQSLTTEVDTICSLMALESEDMDGVGVGDHWEREGAVPGGREHTRFSVISVRDGGLVELAIARDLQHNDGSVAQWRGTMLYNATDFVPSTITLNGNVSSEDTPNARNVALTIRLVHDTFKHY
jgi:hypothetical protein